jgi:hypothetical protein
MAVSTMRKRFPCIVCGGHNDGNHHCPVETEKRIEAARWAHAERVDYAVWYGTRLEDGFTAREGYDV